MIKIDELLEKVPQSVKDKFLVKKRERAIEIVKEDLKKTINLCMIMIMMPWRV